VDRCYEVISKTTGLVRHLISTNVFFHVAMLG